jgi:hypothetical protein
MEAAIAVKPNCVNWNPGTGSVSADQGLPIEEDCTIGNACRIANGQVL